jgi:TonB family protein
MAYLNNEVVGRLRAQWRAEQPARGNVVVQFTIQRSGEVTDIAVVEHADFLLDQASIRPFIMLNRKLPPLPAEYKPPTITLRLTFEYK